MNKGKPFEDLVFQFLTLKGCEVLARNYRSRYGEIDIVALCRNKLLIVEVKGSFKNENPASRVDCTKVRRIYKTYLRFLSEFPKYRDFETFFLTASVKGEKINWSPVVLEDCIETLQRLSGF
ncbi:MAG TPA: YraN family protein [Aquificales bacterium]|nr:YraN family protein [Aquificales bacterium]